MLTQGLAPRHVSSPEPWQGGNQWPWAQAAWATSSTTGSAWLSTVHFAVPRSPCSRTGRGPPAEVPHGSTVGCDNKRSLQCELSGPQSAPCTMSLLHGDGSCHPCRWDHATAVPKATPGLLPCQGTKGKTQPQGKTPEPSHTCALTPPQWQPVYVRPCRCAHIRCNVCVLAVPARTLLPPLSAQQTHPSGQLCPV